MEARKSASGLLSTGGLVLTVIQSTHPEWLGNHPWILPAALCLFLVSLIVFLFQFKAIQHLVGVQPINHSALPAPANSVATATGGSVTIINNEVDSNEIAEAVAKKLDEKAPSLKPGDGFVQLENSKMELQIPSIPLKAGQKFSLKYHYENRGGLPVYDVQTWGLLHILSVELNPPGHLKSIMLDAAKQGREKFPNAGGTLGVGCEHYSFAALSEPLTDDQILGVKKGELALFFIVGGVWRDSRNQFHYWVDGRKAEIPDFPELGSFRWKGI
jgi:hypothetical protein